MDLLTVLGLITGFVAIALGQFLEGGELRSLMNSPALLIVLGGTMGAVMVQTPFRTFKNAMKIFPWIFRPPALPFDQSRDSLVSLAKKSRQYGLLSLEEHIEKEKHPILRMGLELLVIGVDKHTIRQVLENELMRIEDSNKRAAQVFESMGGYSPTIGILGAVLGLIQVMGNLSDPSQLGAGIAVAFVATIYGVGFANLVFLPVANKLKIYIDNQLHHDEMILEGLVGMAGGESPNMLAYKLINYGLHHKDANKKKKASS
ncbi:MAG: flagellar motor protein [Legionellaceae bacterium]|nr:flagellar motor protein [Legionellaceae bacterium]